MFRTLLITGASTGIGQACALAFDREGWTVFAAVRREEDGRALAARASSRLAWLLLDVTNHAQIAAARDTIDAACGDRGLDALVNNAGVAIAAPVEFVPVLELRHQFDVNVFGLVDVTQTFIPLLRKAKGTDHQHRIHRGTDHHATHEPLLRIEARGRSHHRRAPARARIPGASRSP
jgi:NAD(P)-dependent dehydrogenase (short-subunit alcohol dehydrogenase family)